MRLRRLSAIAVVLGLLLVAPWPDLRLHVPLQAAIAYTELTESSAACTSDPCTTATTATPTSGAHVYAYTMIALVGGGVTGCGTDTLVVTGTNAYNTTWTEVDCQEYGVRRVIYLVRAVAASGTAGTITFDYTDNGAEAVAAAFHWVGQFTGLNAADPDDAPTNCLTSTGTSCTIADVGTPDAGDYILAGFGMENNEAFTPEADFTEEFDIGEGTHIRRAGVIYDGTATLDETPSVSWATNASSGGIGLILNVDAAPAATPSPMSIRGVGLMALVPRRIR